MTYFSASNPKPMRAMRLNKPDASNMYLHAGESSASYAWTTEKVNFLLEFMKFIPTFEQALYEGDVNEYQAMLSEFGAPNTFGLTHRVAGENGSLIWGLGMGDGYEDLDFHPDASDFNHINGKGASGATNTDRAYYIPQWLFDKVKGLDRNNSYYQIVMSNPTLSGYTDENAFTLLAGMYESRTRAWAAMTEIFGAFNNTANHAAMISSLEAWYNDPNRGGADPHNIKILISFLKIQHSLTNIMKAYYSGAIDYMNSGAYPPDCVRFPAFNTNLTNKSNAYVTGLYNDYQSKLASYNWAANPANGQTQATKDYYWTQQNNAKVLYDSVNSIKTNWSAAWSSPDSYAQFAGRGTTYYGWDRVGPGDQGHTNYTREQINGLSISMLNGYQTTPQFNSNWVIHALGRESQCRDSDISKVVTVNVINRSNSTKYKQKIKEYYDKKDEDIQEQAQDAQMSAQGAAERKQAEAAANQARQTRTAESRKAEAQSAQKRKESQAADVRNSNNRAQNNKPQAKAKEQENA